MHGPKTRLDIIAISILMAIVFCAATLFAQTATVTRNVNLRSDPSSEYPPIRLLTPSEPPLILLDAMPLRGKDGRRAPPVSPAPPTHALRHGLTFGDLARLSHGRHLMPLSAYSALLANSSPSSHCA